MSLTVSASRAAVNTPHLLALIPDVPDAGRHTVVRAHVRALRPAVIVDSPYVVDAAQLDWEHSHGWHMAASDVEALCTRCIVGDAPSYGELVYAIKFQRSL